MSIHDSIRSDIIEISNELNIPVDGSIELYVGEENNTALECRFYEDGSFNYRSHIKTDSLILQQLVIKLRELRDDPALILSVRARDKVTIRLHPHGILPFTANFITVTSDDTCQWWLSSWDTQARRDVDASMSPVLSADLSIKIKKILTEILVPPVIQEKDTRTVSSGGINLLLPPTIRSRHRSSLMDDLIDDISDTVCTASDTLYGVLVSDYD